MSTSNWKLRHVATSKDSCSYVISTMQRASSLAKAIVEGNVQVHDEALGFVPLEVTDVPEDDDL